MAQTHLCAERIREWNSEVEVEIIPVVTTGDQKQQWSLVEEGGKGLFTRELENALLAGEADIAVHSAKDLPTDMPQGLALAGFLPRAEARDVLVYRDGVEVPETLASSSPRRRTQAKRLFPQAVWTEIRGSVETRLKKIVAGQADGTFLAAAGLARLNIHTWEGLSFRSFPPHVMVPAAGQGAIALQCRSNEWDQWAILGDPETRKAVELERAILARLEGGCQVAIGVHYAGGKLFMFREDWGMLKYDLDWEDDQERDRKINQILSDLQAS